MSQPLANPERRDLPENNDPPIVETSKLISLFAKNIGYDRYILNKCHTDPRFTNNDYLTFPFITLKVQDIHNLFSKSIPFVFFAILFFKVPTWSTRFSHPKVMTLRKQLSESSGSRRVLNLKVSWVVTFGTFRASQSQYHSHSLFLFDIYPVFWAIKTILLYKCHLMYSVVMRCLYKQNNDYLKRQNAFWLNINKKLRTNPVFKSFILIIMVISQSTLFTFHNFLVTTTAVL